MATVMFFRLCVRAPRTVIQSDGPADFRCFGSFAIVFLFGILLVSLEMTIDECEFCFTFWVNDKLHSHFSRKQIVCPEETFLAVDRVETNEIGRGRESSRGETAMIGPSERVQHMADRCMMERQEHPPLAETDIRNTRFMCQRK